VVSGMKYIFLDHNEPETGPECCLAFAVSDEKYFDSIDDFYKSTCRDDMFDEFSSNGDDLVKTESNGVLHFQSLSKSLEIQLGIKISKENVSLVFVVADDADIRDMCIQYDSKYYRYSWRTNG